MRAPLRNGARSPTPWDPGSEKLAGLMDEAEHDVLAFMTFVWTPPGTQGPI